MKSEKGVHRLVRISPFNAAGKRQTSFVSCDVMPDIEEDLDVEINEDDLRIDTYRSSGAGGQHINKTSSAIRITHLPTGIVVQCQNERSQFQNKDKAMQMLKAKLYMLKQQANAEKLSDIRGDIKDIGWGSQILSYVLQPYTMVKDHRTGFESGNVNAVLDGGLDGFISAYLKWTGRRIERDGNAVRRNCYHEKSVSKDVIIHRLIRFFYMLLYHRCPRQEYFMPRAGNGYRNYSRQEESFMSSRNGVVSSLLAISP